MGRTEEFDIMERLKNRPLGQKEAQIYFAFDPIIEFNKIYVRSQVFYFPNVIQVPHHGLLYSRGLIFLRGFPCFASFQSASNSEECKSIQSLTSLTATFDLKSP